jgi:hypothetical protein
MDNRQESIVRQSSLKFVADYCKLIGTPMTLKETVRLTEVISDYCLNGYTPKLGETLDKVDQYFLKKFEED